MVANWIFFDLDGTLADSLPGLGISITEAFEAVGRSLPSVNLRPYIGPGIRVILKNLDSTLTDDELDRMETVFRAIYDTRGVLATSMFSEVEATLRSLKDMGAKLYIVTNKPSLATSTLLKAWDLHEIFDDVVSRNSRSPHYSDKGEMLLDLIDRHGATADQSVFVGDTEEDLAAARSAGMSFIHALYGYGRIDSDNCETIERFGQLLDLCGVNQRA
jgi:phosphoglycolate phosphatase